LIILLLTNCPLIFCSTSKFEQKTELELEIKYSKYFDLVFHVLAYLKVHNASNLYDTKYIEKMAIEKQNFEYDIIPKINLLQEYYNNNFGRLGMINFLPFYSTDFNNIKNVFINFNQFTAEDIKYFINPFVEIMENESTFFFDYWDKLYNDNEVLRHLTEKRMKTELEKFSCIFEYYNKSPSVFLSFTITRNGRGFSGIDSFFSAAIPFPESDGNFMNSFLMMLHEYTHQFTDDLLNRSINMIDGSHALSENVVILTDYYLIKSIDETLIQDYFKLFGVGNEFEFFNVFKVDENLEIEIKKLLDDILKKDNIMQH